MPREVYYSGDVSKPPKAGDKFIQLDWDESSLSLDVGNGIFPDQNSRNPTRRFPTLDNLHELGGKPLPAHCALGTLGESRHNGWHSSYHVSSLTNQSIASSRVLNLRNSRWEKVFSAS
jgi:hypothetical protein